MTMPEDWFEEAAWIDRAERWLALPEGEIEDAPADVLAWLLTERAKALRIIDAWHMFSNHLTRIAESSPTMRVVDALAFLTTERERIEEAKRG